MKKIAALIIGLMCVQANAAYTFPDNATTFSKYRMTLLESLKYNIELPKTVTKDDLAICLAEVVTNDGKDVIKAATASAIIANGKVKDETGFGNPLVIKYDLKVNIQPKTIDIKFYNIGYVYLSNKNKTPESDSEYRDVSTIWGGGGKETVTALNGIAEKIGNCLK